MEIKLHWAKMVSHFLGEGYDSRVPGRACHDVRGLPTCLSTTSRVRGYSGGNIGKLPGMVWERQCPSFQQHLVLLKPLYRALATFNCDFPLEFVKDRWQCQVYELCQGVRNACGMLLPHTRGDEKAVAERAVAVCNGTEYFTLTPHVGKVNTTS